MQSALRRTYTLVFRTAPSVQARRIFLRESRGRVELRGGACPHALTVRATGESDDAGGHTTDFRDARSAVLHHYSRLTHLALLLPLRVFPERAGAERRTRRTGPPDESTRFGTVVSPLRAGDARTAWHPTYAGNVAMGQVATGTSRIGPSPNATKAASTVSLEYPAPCASTP